MSGAVPPISPVTGGAIYEATAKAETVYADAERLADAEFTELQQMASKENEAELTKQMQSAVAMPFDDLNPVLITELALRDVYHQPC